MVEVLKSNDHLSQHYDDDDDDKYDNYVKNIGDFSSMMVR